MSINDQEILELHRLCNSVIDESLSGSDVQRLERWVVASEDARQFYVRSMDQSASLGSYASEMQIEAPDLHQRASLVLLKRYPVWLAVAATFLVVGIAWSSFTSQKATVKPEQREYVAKLTGQKDCQWKPAGRRMELGDFFCRDDNIELFRGHAELTFDSGAVVVVNAPAKLVINSAWDAILEHGSITVNAPTQAIGFRISHPAVEVIDLGTQFSMFANGEGVANVFVTQGEVEAMPGYGSNRDAILLHANESRQFALTGEVPEKDHQSLENPNDSSVSFDRSTALPKHVRWSFDEVNGRKLSSETDAISNKSPIMYLSKDSHEAHADGFLDGGINFDGKLFARAELAGLSSNSPRTVSFWVKVPRDAALSGAYSMVAWRAGSSKLGLRPVHVGWNRNPDEGPLGALRTDFSGGHSMGTTSLRDGRWHHISVVFVPGMDSDTPVQVKQYVDGRLESNRVIEGPKLSILGKGVEEKDTNLTDVLWLGCRLGSGGPKKDRFQGQIDELVISDSSLSPSEITRMMESSEPLTRNH